VSALPRVGTAAVVVRGMALDSIKLNWSC
jgi:hypothetical protein